MILYGNWRSLAVYRVRVALALKAIPHEVVSIDMAGGEHHGERFKAINPQGVLPALDDGQGHVLFQSLAIIDYLDETHPSPPLLPADAVVGLVPGLMSQSRVDNNLELAQLFPLPTQARLSGIGVTFKPDEVNQPLWKFWNRFTHIGDQLKYAGADLIFRQPNDLVVDTASMNQLGPNALIPAIDWRDLGERAQTHHCSYFRDADALAFLDERLR